MSETFTVYAYDLNTNTLLTQLPANQLQFESRLDDSGAISFTILLSKPRAAKLAAPILSYGGNPFAIYVDRNGVIVWGGVAWTGLYTKSAGTLQITGKEFGSYFAQRIIAADYSVTTYPSGIDPALLVAKAYNDAQNATLSGAGSSIGVVVVGGSSTIPPIIPGYPLSQRTAVSQIASDMSSVSYPGSGTVDTTWTSQWVNGAPQTTLQIWSPRAGRVAGSTGLIFDLTRALDYTWQTDATKTGTTIVASGSGSGTAIPVATVNGPNPVGALGQLPRLDQVVSYSDVQSQTQISAMATGLAQQIGGPVITPTVTIPTLGTPDLGSWIAGDDARLYTPGDEYFPNGLDQYWRITEYQTTVPDEGVASVQITFNAPPTI